ncbi:MAG: hypothetical protein KF894_03685 [Labilithrix sp.]|nr:hypothetical protein [Labilithrix sp.]
MSFLEPPTESRCRRLPHGWRVHEQADACRSAAFGFVWSARAPWGKRELARWLAGPYAAAIAATREPVAARATAQAIRLRPVSDDAVRELVAWSYARVIATLHSLGRWRDDPRFARRMIDGGIVVGVIDATSEIGYAPVAAREMRLADRVSSLFVADFLTRPGDYARFQVCGACQGATFESRAEHARACTSAAADPGPRPAVKRRSARRITLLGLGDRVA